MLNNLIVGAGITGLSGLKNPLFVDAQIFDRNVLAGGFTRSVHIDDFVFDYTGHFLHLSKFNCPLSLPGSFDLDQWKLIEKRSACYLDGVFVRAPFQYHLSDLGNDARLYYESYLSALEENTTKEEANLSLDNYFRASFGNLIADNFLIPYNEKLYGSSLDGFSTDSLKRFFPHPVSSKIEAGYKGIADTDAYNSRFWYPVIGGIDLLVKGLGSERQHTVDSLNLLDLDEKVAKFESGKTVKFSKLLSSVSLKAMCQFSYSRDMDFAAKGGSLSSSSTFALNIGFSTSLPAECSDLHWLYFSEKKFVFHRIGFYSNFNQNMAPRGCSSIYVEVGVNGSECDANYLIQRVLRDLSCLNMFDMTKIVSLHNLWMPVSYVHFNRDPLFEPEEIVKSFNKYEVFPAGRYGRWQYTSMEDGIIDGLTVG